MLALILAAATVTAPPLPPDGTYKYTLSYSGQNIGTTAVTLKTQTSAIRLDENASAQMGGRQLSGTATLLLDASLVPTGYTANYQTMRGPLHASVSFAGNTATETSDDGNESYTLSADTKHFAVLDGTMFAGLFVFPAQMQAWNNASVFVVSPMFGRGGPISIDTALRPDRPKNLPASEAEISVSTPVQITIWYNSRTLLVDEVDVPSQDVTYKRTK